MLLLTICRPPLCAHSLLPFADRRGRRSLRVGAARLHRCALSLATFVPMYFCRDRRPRRSARTKQKKTTLLGGLSRGGDNCESAAPQERHTECLHLQRRGRASGFICAARAAACILVDSDAKAPTTQKDHPIWWSFCVVETTGTITPISPHFTHCLRISKNRTTMRFFALFVSARATAKIQIFRKFVYDSCTVLWAGTPLPIGLF